MSDLLSIRGLRVEFGPSVAVHDVSLTVRPGEFVGLVGNPARARA
jgi:ABC-type branched-subunit amino acid transport system ATPase component